MKQQEIVKMEKLTLNELKDKKLGMKNQSVECKMVLNSYTPITQKLHNVNYIVVPVTMIVEGVLNGILYTNEEMFNSVPLWNGRPLVLNHPEDGFSANRISILESTGLGYIFNTGFDVDENDKGHLTAEAWFNENDLRSLAPNLYQRIMSGAEVEVSTGLMLNLQYVEAEFRGEPFWFVSSNYKPDHLAILPEDIGACSLKDGCGLRENKSGSQNVELSKDLSYDSNNVNVKEKNMSNCNCPNKVAHLVEISSLSETEVALLNEAAIDELTALYERKAVEETVEPAQEDNAPADNTNAPEEVSPAETEGEAPVEEVVATEPVKEEEAPAEPEADVVAENNESVDEDKPSDKEEDTEEPAKPADEPVAEVVKAETVDGLADVASENLLNEIKNALAFVNRAKAERIESIMGLSSNKFTKEYLENRQIEELDNIIAVATPTVNYALASGNENVNNHREERKVSVLSTPKILTK